MRRAYLSSFRYLCPLVLFLVIAGGAQSQQQPVQPDKASRELAAEEFVNAKLAIWQQRLKLDDWKISIIMSSLGDLKPSSLGNIRWDVGKKTAVIRVLKCSEYQIGARAMLDDMEFTLVHELIHLRLSSLSGSGASRSEEEHAVNGITDALLKLDRRE